MFLQTLLLTCLLAVSSPNRAEAWDQLWQAGKRAQAIQTLRAEIDGAPDSPIAMRVQLANWQLAAAQFEGALRTAADLPEGHNGLRGRALYFLARYDECLTYLRKDDANELRMRVEALKYLGRLDEVLALLPHMRQVLGPNSVDVLLVEARDQQSRRDYAAAAESFLKVRKLKPLEPEALFGLGQCYLRLKRKDEARALLTAHRRLIPLLDALDFAERGVDIAPSSGPNQATVAEAWQALVPYDPAALQKALAFYKVATRLSSDAERTPIALRFARFHWEISKDTGAALEVLGTAVLQSTDPRLRVRKADYLETLGRGPEALRELRAALLLRPEDPAILKRIARIEDQ